MFLDNVKALQYSNPWDVSLHDRLSVLERGTRRVAYFYESADSSSFRYRAYNMAQVLNDADHSDISASYFFLDDLHLIEKIVNLADVLVICRTMYSHHINQLITRFRVSGKRVLFDIDDLLFDTRYAHLVINTLDMDVDDPSTWQFWFAQISRRGETLRLCDGAITTNENLAAKLEDFSGLPVNVVPNFINREQLVLSESIYREKVELRFLRDDKIRLGYFSGSPSHNLDYAVIAPFLEEVLESDSRVELLVVGYIDVGLGLSRFGRRVKRVPFQDFLSLQRVIASVDFNLMPLQSNVFTNCKSELKYFEAAIVGTLSIASPSSTYKAAIRDGENGYIAQAHQWKSVIQRAIENIATYSDMAAKAHADARSKYAWHNQCDGILRAIGLG